MKRDHGVESLSIEQCDIALLSYESSIKLLKQLSEVLARLIIDLDVTTPDKLA